MPRLGGGRSWGGEESGAVAESQAKQGEGGGWAVAEDEGFGGVRGVDEEAAIGGAVLEVSGVVESDSVGECGGGGDDSVDQDAVSGCGGTEGAVGEECKEGGVRAIQEAGPEDAGLGGQLAEGGHDGWMGGGGHGG